MNFVELDIIRQSCFLQEYFKTLIDGKGNDFLYDSDKSIKFYALQVNLCQIYNLNELSKENDRKSLYF